MALKGEIKFDERNRAIRAARDAGEPLESLAARYGLTRKTIVSIVSAYKPTPAILRDPEYTARAISKAAELSALPARCIRERGRTYATSRARWAVWAGMSRRGMGPTAIGRRFGMDHTTVAYGLEQAHWLAKRDARFAALVEEVNAA